MAAREDQTFCALPHDLGGKGGFVLAGGNAGPTPLWGYNGGFPGPSFETTPGAPIYVKWTNDHYDRAVADSQLARREGR